MWSKETSFRFSNHTWRFLVGCMALGVGMAGNEHRIEGTTRTHAGHASRKRICARSLWRMRTMARTAACAMLLVVFGAAWGQPPCESTPLSFIPNPSFEQNTGAPTQVSTDIYHALDYLDYWGQSSDGTVDYYTPGPYYPGYIPMLIPDGNSVLGLIASPGYYEYAGACLTETLSGGCQYVMRLSIASLLLASLVNGSASDVAGPNNCGPYTIAIYGTTACANIPFAGYGCPPANFDMIGSIDYYPDGEWETLNITLDPNANYAAILLGGACGMAPACPPADGNPYFFIDNLILNESAQVLGLELTQEGDPCSDNVCVNVENPSCSVGIYHWYINGIAASPDPNATELCSQDLMLTQHLATGDHVVVQFISDDGWCAQGELDVITHPVVLQAQPYGPFCSNEGQQAYPIVAPIPLLGSSSWSSLPPEPNWSASAPNPAADGLTSMLNPHIITYHYTNSYGCTDSIHIPFTVNDTTLVTWSPDTNLYHICRNASPILLAPLISHPGGSFEVDCGSGWESVTVFDPAVCSLFLDCPEVPLRYTYTNADNCTSVTDTILYVHPLPDPGFTVEEVCSYDSLEIVNTSTIACGAIDVWFWEITGQPDHVDGEVPPFLYGMEQLVAITLTATSDRGCSASYGDTTVVHPVPHADFTVPDACQYDTVSYTDLSTIAWNNGVDVIDQWNWLFGDGGTSTVQHPQHPWNLWGGSFTDRLIVTSLWGCRDTTTRTITINPAPVNSLVFAPNCFGESTAITSTSTIPQGSIDNTWWELETGLIPYSGTSIAHIFSASPPFFHPIVLHNVSDQGCIAVIDTLIEIFPLPQVDYNLSQEEFCAEGTAMFSDASQVPQPYNNTAWAWYINDALWGTGQSIELAFADSGIYDVALVVTTANGCSDTLSNAEQITVHPLPIACFAADPAHTDIYRTEIQFHDSSSEDVEHWTYHFVDGIGFSHDPDPSYVYATFGTYEVQQIVTNEFDCVDTAYATVIIDPDVIINVPNAFTPDGDGINDVFLPVLDGFTVQEYNLTIWDRWGEMIFETDDEHEAWDGTMGSLPVKDGVYVWQVGLRAQSFVGRRKLRGHVTVLR